ncbi:amidohydrolase family protein [Lonsdalea populi]|uniref:amidohydrolase family protein n=1 Tax=Lonsdalea populi TaxID=1172565 RepID=UPI000A24FCE8|nr:amidohydrolase family protein [Lonsdalea populi]OSM94891.1 hypothetical protein AU508_13170 [Lonsdalea populi]RAT68531.1 hypothetical protein AU504_12565 [Lonsdalea populi]RAT69415.1 hypothetical protein AU505_13860 [Lonsdalea populi]RAT73381.1 hypothetical protein AU506_14190 [Lonsdalea populi]RAT79186.1 hypothetical protein AU507_05140 [Lonsdalea populi]
MDQNLLFKNITYLDSTAMRLFKGDMRVSAGYIIEIGNDIAERSDETVIPSYDFIILPGMVNAHLHPSKEIYGGMLDFSPIDVVLDSVHTNNSLEDSEGQYVASLKSMMSALKKGVTTFGLFTSRIESDIRAAQKIGARAVISYCQNNQWIGSGKSPESKSIEEITCQFFDAEEKFKSSLIVVSPATASELSADDDLIKKLHHIAKKISTKFFVHMHEGAHQVILHHNVYGMSGIERLAKLNVLDSHTTLIHSCHLSEKDKNLLLLGGCNIIHCPVSNSFVGAGTLPLKDLSSMTIGLGTDAAMVNPVNDITFDALMSVYHHGDKDFAKKVSATYILKVLTEGGANSLGLSQTGRIEAGFKADLIFYDRKLINSGYINTPISILKMLNHESPCKVMINGKTIIDNTTFIDSTLFDNESQYSAIREMIKL